MKPLTSLLLGASVMLVSCSSTYGSREEASGAADEWVADSRLVFVRWEPSSEQIKSAINKERKRQEEKIEEGCMTLHRVAGLRPDLKLGQDDFDQRCNREVVIDEKIITSFLVEFNTERSRWCNEEKETKQWVCKEKDVDESIPATESKPMSGDDWERIKTTYTYFRY